MEFAKWPGWDSDKMALDTPFVAEKEGSEKDLSLCIRETVIERFGKGVGNVYVLRLGLVDNGRKEIIVYLKARGLKRKIEIWKNLYKAGYGSD